MSQHPAHQLTWNLSARLSAEGDGFTASVHLADPDDDGRPVWGIVEKGGNTTTGRGRSEMEALRFVDEELRKRQLVISKPWAPAAHFAAFVFDDDKVWIGTLSVWGDGAWMVHFRSAGTNHWEHGKSASAFAACEAAYDKLFEAREQVGKRVA